MNRSMWLSMLYGSAAAALVGSLAGMGCVVALQSFSASPFSLTDGAWLGTSFAFPIGGVIGLSSAINRRDKAVRSDAVMPKAQRP